MATGLRGKVLVVEDDHSMREAIETLLDAAGMDSIMFESAEALLGGCPSAEVACVVSDLKLPGMSGLELMRELHLRCARTPVIVITAHDSPAMRVEAERAGAAAYLAKPFLGSALLVAIKSAISGSGASTGRTMT